MVSNTREMNSPGTSLWKRSLIELTKTILPGTKCEHSFPIGQRVTLPSHFPEPVVLEAVRPIGAGYECRVRLPDGSPDEAILSAEEAELLFGQATTAGTKVAPAEADKLRLLVELARSSAKSYRRQPSRFIVPARPCTARTPSRALRQPPRAPDVQRGAA